MPFEQLLISCICFERNKRFSVEMIGEIEWVNWEKNYGGQKTNGRDKRMIHCTSAQCGDSPFIEALGKGNVDGHGKLRSTIMSACPVNGLLWAGVLFYVV